MFYAVELIREKIITTLDKDLNGELVEEELVTYGDVIAYKVLHKLTEGAQLPPSKGRKIIKVFGVDTKYPKAELINGALVIQEDSTAKSEDEQAKAQEAAIKSRLAKMEKGRRAIALLSIRNEAKSLTTEQVVGMANTYKDVNTALHNGSIETAKALILAIEPDGVVVTADDKTAILDIL